ncbi:MAG: hypothetical protein Q8Q49_00475, partial [bacterium]|nr:hypothetical protein [bacterium]
MRRILVLTSSFPRKTDDWWARFILNIYTHIPRPKYEITVLAPHSPGSVFSETMEGITIKRFPYFFPTRFERITSGQGVLHNDKSLTSKVQVITLIIFELLFFFSQLL